MLTCHTVVVFIEVIMGGGLVYNVADGVLLKSLAFGKSLVFFTLMGIRNRVSFRCVT